jgi:hypothetical protein
MVRCTGNCGDLLSVTHKLSVAIDRLQHRVKNRACLPGMWEDQETGLCGCEWFPEFPCQSTLRRAQRAQRGAACAARVRPLTHRLVLGRPATCGRLVLMVTWLACGVQILAAQTMPTKSLTKRVRKRPHQRSWHAFGRLTQRWGRSHNDEWL